MNYVDVINYAPKSRLYLTFYFLFLLSVSIVYFLNTLYFVMVLTLFMLTLSVYSVFLGLVTPLFSIMLVIIYVGAMMVFIGYICAISPNILFVSFFSSYFILLGVFFPLIFVSSFPYSFSIFTPLTDFLYSPSGLFLFVLIALVLFLVLIIVSSQFFSPQGPFRSVS